MPKTNDANIGNRTFIFILDIDVKFVVYFELLPKFRSTSACIICILKRLKFTIDMAKIQQNMSKSLFLQNILSFVDNYEVHPTFSGD